MNQLLEGRGQTFSSFCTNTIKALKLIMKKKVKKEKDQKMINFSDMFFKI
jgi:hypothetical protein